MIPAPRFVGAAADPADLPATGLPEVAFIGRSNVGKSSLVGLVLDRPGLVRTSRTPGRTQTLNLFVFEQRLAIVDLPGYGYAKVSKQLRAQLEQRVRRYIQERRQLAGVVLVVDARREPVSPYDAYVASWVLEAGRQVLVALTKSDLVPKNRRVARARMVEAQLGVPRGATVLCSAKTGDGRDELVRRLLEVAPL